MKRYFLVLSTLLIIPLSIGAQNIAAINNTQGFGSYDNISTTDKLATAIRQSDSLETEAYRTLLTFTPYEEQFSDEQVLELKKVLRDKIKAYVDSIKNPKPIKAKKSKTAKKTKNKAKTFPVEITKASDIQLIVPKSAVVNFPPDTSMLRHRLMDTAFLPFNGNEFYITYQLARPDCYRIDNLPLEEGTNDTLAIEKQRITMQLIILKHPIANRAKVRNANPKNNSIVKRKRQETAEADKDAAKLEESIKKN